MRKVVIALAVVLGVGLVGYALAHYSGPGYGGWDYMGPGWGGHMMGSGYGGYCWGGPGSYGETKAITQKDADAIARNYINANPNLKVRKIEDKETHFEAEILTKEDSLVARLGIDKNTGWIRPLH
jgi:hypothetical protein